MDGTIDHGLRENPSDGRKSLWTWHPYTGRYIGISN